MERWAAVGWLRMLDDERVVERYGAQVEQMRADLRQRIEELDRLSYEPQEPEGVEALLGAN